MPTSLVTLRNREIEEVRALEVRECCVLKTRKSSELEGLGFESDKGTCYMSWGAEDDSSKSEIRKVKMEILTPTKSRGG